MRRPISQRMYQERRRKFALMEKLGPWALAFTLESLFPEDVAQMAALPEDERRAFYHEFIQHKLDRFLYGPSIRRTRTGVIRIV
jgi:hypothetical protein